MLLVETPGKKGDFIVQSIETALESTQDAGVKKRLLNYAALLQQLLISLYDDSSKSFLSPLGVVKEYGSADQIWSDALALESAIRLSKLVPNEINKIELEELLNVFSPEEHCRP